MDAALGEEGAAGTVAPQTLEGAQVLPPARSLHCSLSPALGFPVLHISAWKHPRSKHTLKDGNYSKVHLPSAFPVLQLTGSTESHELIAYWALWLRLPD